MQAPCVLSVEAGLRPRAEQRGTRLAKDTGVTFVTQHNVNDPQVQAILKPSCA